MLKLTRSILCFLLILGALFSFTACKQNTIEDCVDGQCTIPGQTQEGDQVYAIVSPIGYNAVETITQSPRLDTLDGKNIALVGGSFMASVTLPELKKCILQKYPTATVYMLNEVGSGGPYSVYGQSTQTLSFQNRLQELEIDAVVSGNCGCGLCTTKESGSSIAAEYIGIPSVTVGAPTFIAQIHSTGVNRGVPVLRTAEYPGAFSSHSTEELLENTRTIVFPQVVEALTTQITQEEINLYANDGKRPYDEIIYYGSFDEVQEYYQVNQWTDGLPVIPATDEKVKEYLKYTPYEAGDIIGTFALAYRECTAYTVAVNAVMSGVPAEFMPLCIAFVKGMDNGEWRRPLASTHGWSPYAWLNGPVARQLGIDCGQGMISEENNKALGRFIDLAMLNIGGYYVKENRMGTFGYLSSWVFSEDENACADIGWSPYHVTQGYSWNDNTLTAASALQWGNNVTPATDDPKQIMTLLAWDITEKQQNGLGNTNPQVYRTVFITEYVARNLAKDYPTKNALENALIETARRPLFMRAYANYWANTGSQQFDKYTFEEYYHKLLNDPDELAAMTDVPAWLEGIVTADKIETIATMRKGQTPLLLTGDMNRNKFQVMPGGGYVTVEIELPENWDDLVAPLGYEPLSSFYINEAPKEEIEQIETAPAQATGLVSPEGIKDGDYRIVPSMQQMTEPGRIYCAGKEYTYWSFGADAYVSAGVPEGDFGKLVSTLSFNCSFTVCDGAVTAVIIRPSTVTRKPSVDISALGADFFQDIPLTFSITSKQSKTAGGVTPGGTSVTISSSIKTLQLDLGGQYKQDSTGDSTLGTLDGSLFTIHADAPVGSSLRIGIRQSNNRLTTLTIIKKTADTLILSYKD